MNFLLIILIFLHQIILLTCMIVFDNIENSSEYNKEIIFLNQNSEWDVLSPAKSFDESRFFQFKNQQLSLINKKKMKTCTIPPTKKKCFNEIFALLDLKFGSLRQTYNESEVEITCKKLSSSINCLSKFHNFRFFCNSSLVAQLKKSSKESNSKNEIDFLIMYLCSQQTSFRSDYIEVLSCVNNISNHLMQCLSRFWIIYQQMNVTINEKDFKMDNEKQISKFIKPCCALAEYSKCVHLQPDRCGFLSGLLAEKALRMFVANLRNLCLNYFGPQFEGELSCKKINSGFIANSEKKTSKLINLMFLFFSLMHILNAISF